MKFLIILNDAPYGTERSYNGLRLAGSLARQKGNDVKVFLIRRCLGLCQAGTEGAARVLQP